MSGSDNKKIIFKYIIILQLIVKLLIYKYNAKEWLC